MKEILNDCGNSEISEEILSLWLDYEESRTVEAVLAHQLDKFEMIVQAGKEIIFSILLREIFHFLTYSFYSLNCILSFFILLLIYSYFYPLCLSRLFIRYSIISNSISLTSPLKKEKTNIPKGLNF
jgi:HD domain